MTAEQAAAAARQHLSLAESLTALRPAEARAQWLEAARAAIAGLAEDPVHQECWRLLSIVFWHLGLMTSAAQAAARLEAPSLAPRSIIIAVLDRRQDQAFAIDGLLQDLAAFSGEVIVVFNDPTVFDALRHHQRIDKWAALSANAGVARAWNIGINLAQGAVIFILNDDLRVDPAVLMQLEAGFAALPDALALGVEGEVIDAADFSVKAKHRLGEIRQPIAVDKLSGYCFALHAQRYHDAGISFDPRLSPYFYEELDLMLKARQAGFNVYAVPVDARGLRHGIGISRQDRPLFRRDPAGHLSPRESSRLPARRRRSNRPGISQAQGPRGLRHSGKRRLAHPIRPPKG